MIASLLVVEDDKDLREYLQELLTDEGFGAQTAPDGTTAISIVKRASPDMVILDLGLPDINGETVCTEIRKKYPNLPIIILTAKDTTDDIVKGLELGADDYITKPFEGQVLLARIKARLRHTDNKGDILKIADLQLDNKTLEVKRNEKLIKLTPTEFKLLQYLLSNPNRILTREMILNRVWLYSPDIETRVVDVYMGYLRKKIDGKSPKKLIQSVRGFGYTIKEN